MISNEPLIYIDANTREIDIKGTLKDFVTVTDDHNAETIFFVIDRYFDNVDLYDKVCEIKYMNAIGELDFDTAVNIETFLEDGTEKLKFGWKISNKATKYYGAIKFQIMFYSLSYNEDDITYSYVFNTKVTSIKIEEGLRHYSEINEDNYPDWAHEMYQQIHNIEVGNGLSESDVKNIVESLIEDTEDIFIVNASTSGDTYKFDKHYDEILEAVNANRRIIAFIDDEYICHPTQIHLNGSDIAIETPIIELNFQFVDCITTINIYPSNLVRKKTLQLADKVHIEGMIGLSSSLHTSDKSNIVNAINEVKGDVDSKANQSSLDNTNAKIGTLGNLQTTNKSNAVAAINELVTLKQDVFIVNATPNEDTFILDKNFEQILSAVKTNKQIIVLVGGTTVAIPSRIWFDDYNIELYFPGYEDVMSVHINDADHIVVTTRGIARTDEVDELYTFIDGEWRDLTRLQTENKSNLVAAINELVGNIGSLDIQMGNIDTALTGKADISYVDSAISAAIGEALEGDY